MAKDFEAQREAYARWWHTCEVADAEYQDSEAFKDAEDLGDFAEAMATLRSFGPNPRTFPEHPYPFDTMTFGSDASAVRTHIKRLIGWAQEFYPEFEFVGEVDTVDVIIEALIHPETFDIMVRKNS
jgi:hypothetical protein